MSEKKFSAKSTALEVVEGHDLTGYEVIVTGGASGIGVETVRALAKAKARVLIATRDMKKAEEVALALRKETGNKNIEFEHLDLASLKNVRAFVQRYLDTKRPLHILINNAGIMACPQWYTEDGFEMQFGTNHMGHFALTLGLLPALREGVKTLNGKFVRVVNVSSVAHTRSDIVFDDINFKHHEYDPMTVYGQSKTANILFSIAFNKRYAKEGIYSNSLMPGGIFTNLQKHISREEQISRKWIDEEGNINPLFKTVEQGASTTIWAAVSEELEGKGGFYLEDCDFSELRPIEEIRKNFRGHVEYAFNEENAERLWTISEEWLNHPPNETNAS